MKEIAEAFLEKGIKLVTKVSADDLDEIMNVAELKLRENTISVEQIEMEFVKDFFELSLGVYFFDLSKYVSVEELELLLDFQSVISSVNLEFKDGQIVGNALGALNYYVKYYTDVLQYIDTTWEVRSTFMSADEAEIMSRSVVGKWATEIAEKAELKSFIVSLMK
ncbi:hypothetical protein [Bacillus toyonensis]|uniref:hypothetical protein n=1 Tax=Bacillus toyonensis TaxID=155322 RepID=UPI002E228371|nr:hypothetical protein [Bacillus toyonensis]